ncbi:YHS domain-containing (seleno)protein [Ekhidna sp.]|uniref:YHS domain-containing (seleno)protein n=1 Tax=Ekhidna sp. TaxID=2608089 RepID=UPI003B5011E7
MKIIKIIGIVLVSLLIIALIAGKAAGISPLAFNMHDAIYSENGLALDGYDPVVLVNNQKATLGSENFQSEWMDVTWQFESQENLSAFESNPELYMPASGGYCAFAVGKGFAAPGDPNYSYKSDNGKLYLFSNQDVMDDAIKNMDQVISDADANWKN